MKTIRGENISLVLYRTHLFSAFVGDLTVPIFYVYLPLLAYRLGASAIEIGLVGAATYAVQSFMPSVMGRVVDKFSTKRQFVIIAFLILATVSFIYIRVSNPIFLITTRLFEGVGWSMLWPTVESGIVENYPRGGGAALGVYNLVWSGAAAVGPLLGAVLISVFSLRITFLVTSCLLSSALLVNIASFRWINKRHEGKARKKLRSTHDPVEVRLMHESVEASRALPRPFYMIATALGAMSALVAITFFSPYAETLNISALWIGVITSTYGAARFCTYFLSTKNTFRHYILLRKNRNRKIIAALGVSSLSDLLFLFHNPRGDIYFLAFALIGISYSVVITITQVALIAEVSPSRIGAAAGLFESSVGVGASTGPILAGVIAERFLPLAFTLPAFMFVGVSTLFALTLYKRSSHP